MVELNQAPNKNAKFFLLQVEYIQGQINKTRSFVEGWQS